MDGGMGLVEQDDGRQAGVVIARSIDGLACYKWSGQDPHRDTLYEAYEERANHRFVIERVLTLDGPEGKRKMKAVVLHKLRKASQN